MFFNRNTHPIVSDKWTEVSIILGSKLLKLNLPVEAGEVIGFRCIRDRLVINTSSGIPVIACAASNRAMADAIISVKKLGS